MNDEQMQYLEAMNDDELKAVFNGVRRRLTEEKKTTKKTRQKARKKCPKEEEPKNMRREEASKQATWEEECTQGRAYFLRKDYPR